MDDLLSAPQTNPSGLGMSDGLLSDLWPDSEPSSKTVSSASEIRTCLICGTRFAPRWKKAKTCSTACGVRLGHEKRGNKRRTDPVQRVSVLRKMPILLCVVCQKQFKNADIRVKTCSPECKRALGRQTITSRDVAVSATLRKKRSKSARNQHAENRSKKWPILSDRGWLSQKYTQEEYSQEDIARMVGCSRITISSALKRQNIPIRDGKARTSRAISKVSGPNNWHWKGGIYNGAVVGVTQRGLQWKAIKRRLYAERGTDCEWCGKPSAKRRHAIHHTIPFRVAPDHSDDLLVILCKSCHTKADTLFRRMAEDFFASANCPGFLEAVSTLKSEIAIATTRTDS